MSKNRDAVSSADFLLELLIRSQPELFKPVIPSDGNGKDVGGFIEGLRDRLITMYEKTPR